MGLSSKQVSSSGIDWNQALLQAQNLELPKPSVMKKQQQQLQTQQTSEPLKCPRCDSINTKFCYYNNYNKSQPRHFCRTCKRHWTKGGTLRNVPVGGGRKNKRAKKSTTAASSTTATTITTTSITTPIGNTDGGLRQSTLPLARSDNQKSIAPSLYPALIRPPTTSLQPQQNLMNTRDSQSKDFGIGNGIFMSSILPLPQNQSLLFPFSSSSSSFDTNPCSVSTLRSSNVYNYGEELKTMEEPSSGGTNTQPWEIASTSAGMEMSNYWSWEDLDSLVSTDLNVPWDDSDIKP